MLARTSVHWQSFADNFSPFDAEFNAAAPEDFTDEALSTACSLSPEDPRESPKDTRPGSSERQISPEPARHGSPATAPIDSQTPFSSDLSRNKGKKPASQVSEQQSLRDLPTPLDDEVALEHKWENDSIHSRHDQPSRDQADTMALKAFLKDVTPPPSLRRAGTAPTGNMSPPPSQEFTRSSEENPPKSSHSSRPSTSDIWRSFKPKVKLFPRPVPDDQAQIKQRPVDDDRQRLPPGLKAKKRTSDSDRPKSRKSEKQHATNGSRISDPTSPRPDTGHRKKRGAQTESEHGLPTRTKVSSANGSNSPALKALPPRPPHAHSNSASGYSDGRPPAGLGINVVQSRSITPTRDDVALMSPEKQRLMKAMEIRKKQLKATEGPAPPSLRNESMNERIFNGTAHQIVTGKIDSAVGIDLMSLEDSGRDRTSRNHSGESNLTTDSSPRHARKPNPALQSHPVRPDDACFFHASQDRRKPPPLPPPPKDLVPPTPPKDAVPMSASQASSPGSSVAVPPPRGHWPKTSSAAGSLRDPSPTLSPKDVSRKSSWAAQSPSAHPGTSPPVKVQRPTGKAHVTIQSVVSSNSRSNINEEQSTDEVINSANDATRHTASRRELESQGLDQGPAQPVPRISASDHREKETSGISPAASSFVDVSKPGKSAILSEKKKTHRRIPPPLQSTTDGISVARKGNVSSGISRRIQALAERTGSDSRPSTSRDPSTPRSPASSFLVPGAVSSYGRSARTSIASSFESSRDVSPLVSPRSPRRPFYRQFSSESTRTDDGRLSSRKRDTLSITAHIQGNNSQRYSGRSQTIEEEAAGPDDLVHQQPPAKRQATSRTSFARSERPASTVSTRPPSRASTITNDLKRTSLDIWRSMGRGKKTDRTSRTPTSLSNTSLDRVDERPDRRGSRSNNLLKRMSGLSTGTRKSMHSNASRTSVVAEPTPPLTSSKPAACMVGDLNVQFPDSLVSFIASIAFDVVHGFELTPLTQYSYGSAAGLKSMAVATWCLAHRTKPSGKRVRVRPSRAKSTTSPASGLLRYQLKIGKNYLTV